MVQAEALCIAGHNGKTNNAPVFYLQRDHSYELHVEDRNLLPIPSPFSVRMVVQGVGISIFLMLKINRFHAHVIPCWELWSAHAFAES